MAQQLLDKAMTALRECYSEGPVTGVLITIDHERAALNIHTLNHDFTDVFRLLMSALNIVHEREISGRVINNYNLH